MPWESDEENVKPGRDWTRIVWVGIVLLVIAGAAAMFIPRGRSSNVTEARVSQILIKLDEHSEEAARAALEEMQSIRQRILDGENFAKLAAQYSDDTWSAPRGGDLGWVRRGELLEGIDEFVWTAPVGQVSEVMVSSHGLHLILIVERHFSTAEQYDRELKERVLDGGATSAPDGQ